MQNHCFVSAVAMVSLLVAIPAFGQGPDEHHCSLHAGSPIEHKCYDENVLEPAGVCWSQMALEGIFGSPLQCAWPYNNWAKCVEFHMVIREDLACSPTIVTGDPVIPAGSCFKAVQQCGDGRVIQCAGTSVDSDFREIYCEWPKFGGGVRAVQLSCRDGDPSGLHWTDPNP